MEDLREKVKKQERLIAEYEKIVNMYERVLELSRIERIEAEGVIKAHEVVEQLARNELIEKDKIIEAHEKAEQLARSELMDATKTISAHEIVEELARQELIKKSELERIKDQFFANVSHEIRTPITLMIAPLESILEGSVGSLNTVQRSYLKIVYENTKRLLKMVNDLLDLSKIEAGKMKMFYEHDDFVSFAAGLVDDFDVMANRNNIEFIKVIPSDEVYIYFDKEKMERVIINLMLNAFKYSEESGKIIVEIENREDEICFSVFNSGGYIKEDDLPYVFDRFSRFYAKKKSNIFGTGLGLALAKEFIDLHKGKIGIESKRGVGTKVWFTLKKGISHIDKSLIEIGWGSLERRTEDRIERKYEVSALYREINGFYSLKEEDLKALENAIKKDERVLLFSKKRQKIAIIDDNKEMRGFLRFVFSRYYDVYDAEDGKSGIELVRSVMPDIVISDVMMPGLDGYDLCKILKSDKKTRNIPIILLTARGRDINALIKGLEAGADEYIAKPFNIKELVARTNALLRFKLVHDQLERSENVIYAFANAVEAKDNYTENHCLRLGVLSKKIAEKLKLPSHIIESIKNGAILHDIGKIGIPDAILNKPSRLTNEEYEVIKRHPVIGARICSPLKNSISIIPIIKHHHERWDGKGYPDGLAGEKIPLEARIVAVADTFDAMVTTRPYRRALSIDEALKVFEKEIDSGQWDREIVKILFELDFSDYFDVKLEDVLGKV